MDFTMKIKFGPIFTIHIRNQRLKISQYKQFEENLRGLLFNIFSKQ